MRSRTLLLLGLLGCWATAAAAQADQCATAVAPGEGAPGDWEMLPDSNGDMIADIPDEVLNATLRAFIEGWTPGLSVEADARPEGQQWVPCDHEDRQNVVSGCHKVPHDEGGESLQLLLNITCHHTGHDDFALAVADVEVAGDAIRVNITDVQLELDDSHLGTPACVDPFCAKCQPLVAVEGQDEGQKQVCNACAEGNSLNTTYAVCMPNPTDLDFSQGPEGRRARRMLGAAYPGADDKLCAYGFYIINGDPDAGCAPCTRPGCALNGGQDCEHCFDWQSRDGDCVDNQWCRTGCEPGFFPKYMGCFLCSEQILGCARCEECAGGPACHAGAVCRQCILGYNFKGDGTGRCVPQNESPYY